MRRPRFSLRVALLAFTLIGLGLGLYGSHLVEYRRQIRLVEVARQECEKEGCLDYLIGSPSGYIIGITGPRVSLQSALAIREAPLIKRVFVNDPAPGSVDTALSAGFHRADDYSPEFCIWDRNGWDVPKLNLDRRR